MAPTDDLVARPGARPDSKGHVRAAFDSSAVFRIWTDPEPLQAEAAGSDTVWRCRLAISVDSMYLANPAGRWEVRQGWMKQSGLRCGPGSSDAADLPKRAACIAAWYG